MDVTYGGYKCHCHQILRCTCSLLLALQCEFVKPPATLTIYCLSTPCTKSSLGKGPLSLGSAPPLLSLSLSPPLFPPSLFLQAHPRLLLQD